MMKRRLYIKCVLAALIILLAALLFGIDRLSLSGVNAVVDGSVVYKYSFVDGIGFWLFLSGVELLQLFCFNRVGIWVFGIILEMIVVCAPFTAWYIRWAFDYMSMDSQLALTPFGYLLVGLGIAVVTLYIILCVVTGRAGRVEKAPDIR